MQVGEIGEADVQGLLAPLLFFHFPSQHGGLFRVLVEGVSTHTQVHMHMLLFPLK